MIDAIIDGDFGGWLREAMAVRCMSPRVLATLVGIETSTVRELASGERLPTLGIALALVRMLEEPSPSRSPGPSEVEARARG